jgi:hypothetical protein
MAEANESGDGQNCSRSHYLFQASAIRSASMLLPKEPATEREATRKKPNTPAVRAFLCLSSDNQATGLLRLLGVADFSQYAINEAHQLFERVKSCCLGRCNVLNPALESPSFNISLWSKLDNKSRLVLPLPSFHDERTIVRARVVSHKDFVKFR